MKNYPAIALLSLLGLSLSATAALSTESPVPQLKTSTTQYMLSAQTQQRGDRAPRRGVGRYDFIQVNTDTQALQ